MTQVLRRVIPQMKKTFCYISFFFIALFNYQLATALMPEFELTETEATFVKNNPVIKVANEMDWPPFDYTELGKPAGFSIDYIRLLAKKAGLEIEFISGFSWNELLKRFKTKDIDVIPAIYHNKERESFTLFTEPYHKVRMGVLTRDNEGRIKKFSNLAGKRVGIQESDGIIPILKAKIPGITLLEHANNETLIDLLGTRQLDAVIGNSLLLTYLAKRNQAVPLHLETLLGISSEEPQKTSLHVGVRKDLPILHQILEKSLHSVTTEEMTKIEKKWFLNQNPVKPPPIVKLTPEEEKFIQKHPEVLLAGGLSFAPYVMYDNNRKAIGHDVEIANLIEEKTGLKIRFVLGTWKEIQERAKIRELDGLASAVLTKEREAYYNPSKPYFHYTPMVIVKKDNPEGIHSLDDISGKRVALQRGNAFKNILETAGKEIQIIYYDSIHELIKAVVSEEADYTLLDESAFYIARQLMLENMIEGAFTVGESQGIHFLLRNDWPELETIVNKGISAITRTEKLEISKRWFGANMNKGVDSKAQIPLTPDEKTYLLQKGTVKVCIDPTWMPYEHINHDGVHEGMSADYLKIFSDHIGVHVELYPTTSWPETLDAVKNGHCDVIPLAKASEDRRSHLNFTTPYLSFPYVIATKTDEFFIEDIGQALDKTFAVTRGYLVGDELRQKYPQIKLLEVDNNIEGFQKIRGGEAYGYIGATATLAYALHQEDITDIKITGKLPMGFELGIASRKDEPLLHDLFQKAVDTLTQEEKKRIYNKWIAVNVHKIVDYTLLWKILVLVAIILAVFAESHRRVSKSNKKLIVLNSELVTAMEEIKTLRGIIPICSYCKKIRDDKGMWNQLEAYLDSHSDAEFSHGACPECFSKAMEDID
jgi:ABC-type amino acid transport substrate-binding protein